MKKNINWYLCKLDRLAAWTLLGTMFVYFISGYGMTKGIIDTRLATQLHNTVLPLIVLTSFSIHTFYAIRLAFKRWRIWDSFGKYLLVLVYLIFITVFLYVNFWYAKTAAKTTNTNKAQAQITEKDDESADAASKSTVPNTNTTPTQTPPATQAKVLTASVVAQHNNSNDCWIILSNIVYDVSSYTHSGPQSHILCGEDNTSVLSSVHGSRYSSYFSSYKVGALGSTY
ncbi:MAG: cytochrome b5-like heme/steroid binding domain-containing protein [bacterium]